MTGEEFEDRFQDCARTTGEEYVTARDTLLAEGISISDSLRAKLADAGQRTTAEILLGWIARKPTYVEVKPMMQRLKTAGPRGRTVTPSHIARTLAGLGPSVVPRLIEMLTKTDEAATGSDPQIVMQALGYMRDRRAVQPLLGLMRSTGDGEVRVLAMATLGDVGERGDPDILHAMRQEMATETRDPAGRGAAILCLGRISTEASDRDRLIAMARDRNVDTVLRESAIRAMGHMWQGQDTALFAGSVPGESELGSLLLEETDEALALECVGALDRITGRPESQLLFAAGGPALSALTRAQAAHASLAVRRAAADVIRSRSQ